MNDTLQNKHIPDNVQRLLVIRQSALGDIVNALYSLKPLRRALPNARIDWVVDDRFRDLFDAVDGVDDVIVYPRRRWGQWSARPWQWPRLIAEWIHYRRVLCERRYEVAIDLQGNSKSGFSLRASRAPLRIRFDRKRSCRDEMEPEGRRLRADQFRELLRRAGVNGIPEPFPWRIPAESTRWVDAYLGSNGLAESPFAVLHPGSSAFGTYKRWPSDRYAMLAQRLAESGTSVVVVWGPGEKEMAAQLVSEARASRKAGSAGIHLALETRPLSTLVALLKRACVFIGNDSGPLHVASACGTPTVGLYGPKDPGIYAPCTAPRDILYYPLPCSPCGRRRCNNPECMKALSVDTVFLRTQALMRDRSDHPFVGVPLRDVQGRGRMAVDAPPPVPGPFRICTTGMWRWTVIADELGPMAHAALHSKEGLPGRLFSGNARRRYLRFRLCRFDAGGTPDPERGRDAFVKVYAIRGAAHRLRQWVGQSQADIEFRRLVLLHEAGAPVPAPIARGEGPGSQALVLEDLGDVPTVRDRLESGLDASTRRNLLRRVALAVADLHAAGFVHEDLHAGNILELRDATLRVIDVQRGRMTTVMTLPLRALTLAHVCLSISTFSGVRDRCRLIRQYADRLELDHASRRTLAEAVVKAYARLRHRYILRQMERARKGGSRTWIGPWQGGLARASQESRNWLDAPETLLAVIKDEAGRRVIRVKKSDRLLAVKEESRRRRGIRSWIGSHGWLAAGLPTPRPYFLIEPPRGPVRFATEWLEGTEPVHSRIEARIQAGVSLSWRRDRAWRLGRFVRRLHDTGVRHADLKAGNLLIREGEGGGAEFFALDLDRVDFHPGPVPPVAAMSNLAQLNGSFAGPVTRTDRLRVFFAYAAQDRNQRRDWKTIVRQVMVLTRKRHHRWPR